MTRTTHSFSFLALISIVTGCTAASSDAMSGDDGGSDDTQTAPDASTPPVMLDAADCDLFATNAAAAQNACGVDVSSAEKAALASACKKGVTSAALCGGDPAAGLACFESSDPTDWVCQLGAILPYCNNDLEAALGMYCLVKLGDPRCASISCDSSLDCSTGWGCNEVTGKCFSQDANCVGLPCESSLDCPTGETCNQAEHACVRN